MPVNLEVDRDTDNRAPNVEESAQQAGHLICRGGRRAGQQADVDHAGDHQGGNGIGGDDGQRPEILVDALKAESARSNPDEAADDDHGEGAKDQLGYGGDPWKLIG